MRHDAGYIQGNFRALFKHVGLSASAIFSAGSNWFENDRAASKLNSTKIRFPSHQTISSYVGKGLSTRIDIEKVAAVFLYLGYGRLGRSFSDEDISICRRHAYLACDTYNPNEFMDAVSMPILRPELSTAISTIVTSSDLTHLLVTGIDALLAAKSRISEEVASLEEPGRDPSGLFDTVTTHSGAKPTFLDRLVEEEVRKKFGRITTKLGKVHVEGEESIKSNKFKKWNDGICVLADAMDGTSLAAMGIPLWCSALVVFHSRTSTILGSVVVHPTGKVCVSRYDSEPSVAWIVKRPKKGGTRHGNPLMGGPSSIARLDEARVAFFGQKAANFGTVTGNAGFVRYIDHLRKTNPDAAFRIYNFAGNPVIARMVDRKHRHERSEVVDGVDLVFELKGQQPHDFIPGAFLALQMGAFMCTPEGEPITKAVLGQMLQRPTSRCTYILAGTEALARNFRREIGRSAV